MGDVIVRVLDFDTCHVGASVEEDENGDYNLYVNARYGFFGQLKAFEHEMDHIDNDDFRNGLPLEVCEARAKKAAGE